MDYLSQQSAVVPLVPSTAVGPHSQPSHQLDMSRLVWTLTFHGLNGYLVAPDILGRSERSLCSERRLVFETRAVSLCYAGLGIPTVYSGVEVVMFEVMDRE